MTTTTNSVLQVALAHRNFWGKKHAARVAEQLIEEMAELTAELSHHLRGRDAPGLIEEMADVDICLSILKDALGIRWEPKTSAEIQKEADYRAMITMKCQRLDDRIVEIRAKRRPIPVRASS
jgi:NTP pyrophosphatase (non-canonical NTP hydrolase)